MKTRKLQFSFILLGSASKWTSSLSVQNKVINVPSDQESPEFDLCAEDIIIEDDEDFSDMKNGSAAVNNSSKPLFNKQVNVIYRPK